MTSRFAALLNPITPDKFFEQYWGRDYLYIPGGVELVVTLDELDTLLQSQQLPAGYFDVFRSGVALPKKLWSIVAGQPGEPESIVNTERLLALYGEGGTILVVGAHQFVPRLGLFCRNMAQELSLRTQANVYMTPPDSQGFSRHADSHEVIVLQVHGSKKWRLFPGGAADGVEIETAAGSLLYIPRGLEHEARASDSASIHVALGLRPVYEFQLVEELASVAAKHPEFQKAVPRGDMEAVSAAFLDKLMRLAYENPADSLRKRRDAELSRRQDQGWAHRLIDFVNLHDLGADSRVHARPDQVVRMSEDGEKVTIECGENRVELPKFLRNVAEQLLAGEPVTVKSLQGLVSLEGKVRIARDFVKAGLVTIIC